MKKEIARDISAAWGKTYNLAARMTFGRDVEAQDEYHISYLRVFAKRAGNRAMAIKSAKALAAKLKAPDLKKEAELIIGGM